MTNQSKDSIMIEQFLDRASAPLSEGQWAALDQAVIDTASRALVGRRFIPLFGPLGPGVQTVPLDKFNGAHMGELDLTGEIECGIIKTTQIKHIVLPIVHKDFVLLWRNVATGQQLGLPLDVAPASSAAAFTARKEDDLIFNGDADLGLEGLLTVEGRAILPLSDWSQVGNAFSDVTAAVQKLVSLGFYGPYALVVPPMLYARMHGVHERTGVLEIRNVEELTTAGVFRSPVLPENRAVVAASGAQNLDLAIAQDMAVAYLGPEKMNHLLRVFEILALRIKRPQAIVTLEG
jgi:uncharacterized linocin/CFP29 family protein